MEQSGEKESGVKEMMQKLAGKFEDKWDVSKNTKFEDKWDINKNTKFQDKYVNKISAAIDQQRAQKGNTNTSQIGKQRNADKDNNNTEKQETGAVQSSNAGKESSHQPSPRPSGGNPYVLAPVATSQSGLEA